MSISFSRVNTMPQSSNLGAMRSVAAPKRAQQSGAPAPITAPKHMHSIDRSKSGQGVTNRKNLESKDVMTTRINESLAKLQNNGVDIQISTPTKTSKMVSALKAAGKSFFGLFSKATNLVIGAVKLVINAVPVTITGLISIGQKIAQKIDPSLGPKDNQFLVEKYLEAAKPMNEAFDTAMNTVTKFFAGEYFGKDTGQEDALASSQIAADVVDGLGHEGLGQAADGLGMNFVNSEARIGQVGQQGELAMQLGMTTAIAGGVEGGQTLFEGIENVSAGGGTRMAGKAKMQQALQIKDKLIDMQTALALQTDHQDVLDKVPGRSAASLSTSLETRGENILDKNGSIANSKLKSLAPRHVQREVKRLGKLSAPSPEESKQLERLNTYQERVIQHDYAQIKESHQLNGPVKSGDLPPLVQQIKRLDASGQVLKQAGTNQQTQGVIDMGRGLTDMAMSANGVVNLMVGSDTAKHLIASTEAAQTVTGTATQIIGSGVMVVTKGIECGLDIKRAINSDQDSLRAKDFVDTIAGDVNTMEDEMVVAAVKQFEKKQASSGFLSKVKAVLNGALAVAGIAVIAATVIAGAVTPVGWIVGGAALLVGAGLALHQAYKSQRETDNVSALESTQAKVQGQMSEMIEEYAGRDPSVDILAMTNRRDPDFMATKIADREAAIGKIDGKKVAQMDKQELKEHIDDPATSPSLKKELVHLQRDRDREMLMSLQNISDEIDLALVSISPTHAADTLAEIVFKGDNGTVSTDSTGKNYSSASAKAREAMRTVFKLSPHVFQSDPSDPTKPVDEEAFQKGREILQGKLSSFYTHVFDDSALATVKSSSGQVKVGR